MKAFAIKQNHLYSKTYQRGKRFSGRYVSIYVLKDLAAKRLMLANPEKKYLNRVGISVGKRVGCAVERNRAKRIVRESFRLTEKEHTLKKGMLIVISIRPEINGKKMQEVKRDMIYGLKKLEMFADQQM